MVENHTGCKDVAILTDIAKIVKTSVQFNEVEQLIDDLMKTVDKIRQNREKNLVDVSEQKRIAESEIRELRTKINNHLDKLQEDLMKKLTEAEANITGKTCELLSSIDEKEKELIEYQTNVVNIKQYASDLQTFLAMKQIENGIDSHDTSVHALVNSDSLNQTKLSCKIDRRLKNIVTSIEKFGEVIVESNPCEFSFVRRKDKQAQMMKADLPPMSVNNIHLNLKRKINVMSSERTFFQQLRDPLFLRPSYITGCSLLPDSRMVCSFNNDNTVRFFDKDGVALFQVDTDKRGYHDTVYIKDNNSVAVSCGGRDRCITIIDIESQQVITTFAMDTEVYGMAVRGSTIYYSTWDNGLKMLNLSDKSVSDIINSGMSNISYVATSGDKLYYTDCRTHTVTCCDLHGTTQWEFNDKRVIPYPHGITVDNDGNVYVTSCKHNVVVISPDGRRHRQLLFEKYGPWYPNVLDYDISTNRLLVACRGCTTYLFDVKRGQ